MSNNSLVTLQSKVHRVDVKLAPKSKHDVNLLTEVGNRIKNARLVAKLTQEQAASLAEIDVRRWQRIERGRVNLTLTTCSRIADVVGLVSVWELFGSQ